MPQVRCTPFALLPLCLLLAAPALAQPVESFDTVDDLVDAYNDGDVDEGDYVRVRKVRASNELRSIGRGGDFHDHDEYQYVASDDNGAYEVTVVLSGSFDSSYDPTGTVDMDALGIDSTQIGLDDPDIKRGYELEAQGFLEFRGNDGMFIVAPIGNSFSRAYDDRHYTFDIQQASFGYYWEATHKIRYHSQVHDPLGAPTNLRLRPSGDLRPGQLMIVSADGIDATHTLGRLVRADGSRRTLNPVMRTASVLVLILPRDTPDGVHELQLVNPDRAFSAPLTITVGRRAPVITSAIKVERTVIVTLSDPVDIASNVELRVWRYTLENVRVGNTTAGQRTIVQGDLPANPQADRGRTVKVRINGGRWSASRRLTLPASGAAGALP